MTLKIVVLPAPFGPINPVIVPSSTSNETSSSALIPPKRRCTFRTESRLMGQPRFAHERGGVPGEPGGSPTKAASGRRGSVGETWFPPRERAEGERRSSVGLPYGIGGRGRT